MHGGMESNFFIIFSGFRQVYTVREEAMQDLYFHGQTIDDLL